MEKNKKQRLLMVLVVILILLILFLVWFYFQHRITHCLGATCNGRNLESGVGKDDLVALGDDFSARASKLATDSSVRNGGAAAGTVVGSGKQNVGAGVSGPSGGSTGSGQSGTGTKATIPSTVTPPAGSSSGGVEQFVPNSGSAGTSGSGTPNVVTPPETVAPASLGCQRYLEPKSREAWPASSDAPGEWVNLAEGKRFIVDAKRNTYCPGCLFDTGIDVKVGDEINSYTTGTWNVGTNMHTNQSVGTVDASGGFGAPINGYLIYYLSPCDTTPQSMGAWFVSEMLRTNNFGAMGSLMGVIGDSNDYFLIGNHVSNSVYHSGRLYLFAWDDNPADNSGQLSVELEVYRFMPRN